MPGQSRRSTCPLPRSKDIALHNRIAPGKIKTLKTINGKVANEYLEEIKK